MAKNQIFSRYPRNNIDVKHSSYNKHDYFECGPLKVDIYSSLAAHLKRPFDVRGIQRKGTQVPRDPRSSPSSLTRWFNDLCFLVTLSFSLFYLSNIFL